MLDWQNGLRVKTGDRRGGLWMDCRDGKDRCFVSHGHADHLGPHASSIATTVTSAIGKHRIDLSNVTELAFGEELTIDGDTTLRLVPAGHVLGSAMLHVTRPEGTLLYTGDYKLAPSRTCERAETPRADYLVMESTYGLPHFRFPHPDSTATNLCEMAAMALRSGKQPIVYGYSLGKAQEIVKILTDAGFNVTQHGAVATLSDLYEEHGVDVGKRRRYDRKDFHGPKALDLEERGVLVAPPQAAKGAFSNSFKDSYKVMMSGWALTSGAVYRYQVDACLPLSDHADFGELLETIDRVGPKVVYTHHGFKEFPDHLKKRGINAKLARPAAQLELF